ncbi:hypothetical protein WBG78_00560 [Chryseolinea sp. T2]|uniref:hypothetical protein n=1 Tax=Chryseolinea sp. T2 TaxID=3129255 RepID=UPI0030774113
MRLACLSIVVLLLISGCGDGDVSPSNNSNNGGNNGGNPTGNVPNTPQITSCLLSGVTTSYSTYTYVRNDAGLVTAINYKYGSYTGGCTIEYNADGLVTRINDDNFYRLYAYNSVGKIETETTINEKPTQIETSKVVITFGYNDLGQMVTATYGNGAYFRYEYDTEGNTKKIYFSQTQSGPEMLSLEYLEFDDKIFSNKTAPFSIEATLTLSGVQSIRTKLNMETMLHNCKSAKQYSGDGSSRTFSFDFTYNQLGNPLTAGDATFSYSCK